MRRPHLGIVVIASTLALAGCATSGSGGPSPTPAPTPSTPAAPAIERRPLMAYPDMPSPAWTFTAQDSGVGTAAGELTLVDPTLISQSVEGFVPPAPIDAGGTLVMAVRDGDGPATLVGIDADRGTARWSYTPERGQLTECARDLLGSTVACGVYDRSNASDAGVVLVDPGTGQEVASADLPGTPVALDVAGGSVVSLTLAGAAPPEDQPQPYDVSAHDVSAALQWSTEIVREPNDFGRGLTERVTAGPALTAVELSGSVFVLAADDGGVLLERDGNSWGWFSSGDDGGLLYDEAPDSDPLVTVVAADGSEVATLPGFAVLRPVLDDQSASTYLLDPDGQVVSVSTVTGATDGTGVTPAAAPGPTGFLADPAVSLVGGTVVVLRESLKNTLFGHGLGDPGSPAWEHDIEGWFGAFTDGTTLYATGLATDVDTSEDALVLSALDPADGSLTWTLSVAPQPDPVAPATIARGGGHLVVMEPTRMTALAP